MAPTYPNFRKKADDSENSDDIDKPQKKKSIKYGDEDVIPKSKNKSDFRRDSEKWQVKEECMEMLTIYQVDRVHRMTV